MFSATNYVCFLCLLFLLFTPLESAYLDRVIFVINSQPDPHHASVAQETHDLLVSDLQGVSAKTINVIITHNSTMVDYQGAWTYLPVIEAVHHAFHGLFDFLVFLEEDARVDLDNLVGTLSEYSPDEESHVGYALKDSDKVIMHYYDEPDNSYPHPEAGFVLTSALVNLIASKMEYLSSKDAAYPKYFSIDSQYELAKAISHLHDDTNGTEIRLIQNRRFCIKRSSNCAVYPHSATCKPSTDEDMIQLSMKTLFAVKTCGKFHHERLPVVQDTWAGAAPNLIYFSEVEDPDFGTVVLEGVRNTEKGHCGKTEAIIKYFAGLEHLEWLVIADDDTVLGVKKILEQIWCYGFLRENGYQYNNGKGTILGQRYGYKVAYGGNGYDYITGGGGMILDRSAAESIVNAGHSKGCSCPSPDFPDDKFLGICSANLGLNLVHSPRFHQCKPEDYHPDLLTDLRGGPVSFHKHYTTNPRATYDKYFSDSDNVLAAFKRAEEKKSPKKYNFKEATNIVNLMVYFLIIVTFGLMLFRWMKLVAKLKL